MKRLFALAALILPVLPVPGFAAMTDWTEVHGGAVRLIAPGQIEDGQYLAGLEFLLEPGWHTYWRYPGEAGIPPQISSEGSANVEALEVLYPAPERYSDGFSESIVYHNGIVLPLKITPADPGRPVSVSIDLFFGVCSDICVPGEAALALELSPTGETDALAARLIRRDLDNVPSASASDHLGITSVGPGDSPGMLSIEAEIGDAGETDLFAAGPEGSFIALPKLAGRTGTRALWSLSTKGLSTTEADDTLRLVLTADGKSVEHLAPIAPDWID